MQILCFFRKGVSFRQNMSRKKKELNLEKEKNSVYLHRQIHLQTFAGAAPNM